MNRPAKAASVLLIPLLALLATLALFGAMASAAPDAPQALCTVDGGGGGDHTTIAGALADSGCDPIQIAPGTYYENVTINRDVTMAGAGATSTIIDGNGGVTSQRVMSITTDRRVSISAVTIQSGHAASGAYGGGGISNRGYLTLTEVILTNNSVAGTTSEDVGGAISPGGIGHKRLVLHNCTVSHNQASAGGGVFFNGTLEISNTLFYSNTANAGGGLLSYDPATLVNVTFSDNYAGNNGSAMTSHEPATLVNCTIVENGGSYALEGGGVYTLANTLLANNPSGNCDATINSSNNNLEDGDTCGLDATNDITDTSPLLGPLADHGGLSWTHALGPGSRGIDEGGASLCPATDQRGWDRPFDGDGNGIAVCDIGAFEFYPGVYLPLVLRSY